jgi:aminoglycoside phosphotransferase (APT) family kinase protein
MNAIDDVAAALSSVIAERLGPPGEVLGLTRLTGGATRATWSFDAVVGAERLPLVLQRAGPHEAPAGNPIARLPRVYGESEAALLAAAARSGVPVPRVLVTLGEGDPLGPALVSTRIEGETLGRRIVRDEAFAAARRTMAAQCGEILAQLHRVDARAVPGLVVQSARDQISLYRDILASIEHPYPAVELGLNWIGERLPAGAPAAVVHGDFRNGNLVVGPEGIRAVLDWEIAHLGDPMEDLGWLCVRTWRFGGRDPVGGFGRREDLFAAYERATGAAVDVERVRFWEAFGSVKWSIMCMMKGLAYRRGGERTVEALAIGRRSEEPIWDFLALAYPGRRARVH